MMNLRLQCLLLVLTLLLGLTNRAAVAEGMGDVEALANAEDLTDDLSVLGYGRSLSDLRSFLADHRATDISPQGRTALMVVARWPDEERRAAAALLLDAGAPVNAVDEDGQTALSLAAGRRDASLVRTLLDAGARVDQGSPLISAIISSSSPGGDLDGTVRALLAQGTPTEECDRHGRRALQRAAVKGEDVVVSLLLASGADPEAPDPRTGDPPLHSAALSGSKDAVDALLAAGSPVDARNPYDCSTALHRAAAAGRQDVVRTLLGAGAMVNKTEHRGDTAWELAVGRGHVRVAEILQKAGGRSAALRTETCVSDVARERRPCVASARTQAPSEAFVDGDFSGALQRVEEIVAAWEEDHQTMVAREIVLEIQTNLAYATGMLCTRRGSSTTNRLNPCRALLEGGAGLRIPIDNFLSSTLLEGRPMVDSPFSRFAASLGVDSQKEMGYPSPQPNRSSCIEFANPTRVELPALGGSQVSAGPIQRVCVLPGDYEIQAATELGSKNYHLSASMREAWLTETSREVALATSVLPALDIYCPDPDGGVDHPMVAFRGRDARPSPGQRTVPFAQSSVGRIDIVDTQGDCGESCEHALELSLVQSIQIWLGACESCSPSSLRALAVGDRVFVDRVLLDRLLLAEDLGKALAASTPIKEEGSLHMNRFSVGGPRPRKAFPPYIEVFAESALTSALCIRLSASSEGVERQLHSLLCPGPSPLIASEASLQVRLVEQANCTPGAIACATVDEGISLSTGLYRFVSSAQGGDSTQFGSGQGQVDLTSVLIHEVGHWFGVPHLDDPRTTPDGRVNAMYPSLPSHGFCVTTANMQMLDNASRPEWYYRQRPCAGLLPGGE